jgi:hypothetical protein
VKLIENFPSFQTANEGDGCQYVMFSSFCNNASTELLRTAAVAVVSIFGKLQIYLESNEGPSIYKGVLLIAAISLSFVSSFFFYKSSMSVLHSCLCKYRLRHAKHVKGQSYTWFLDQ